MLVCVFVCVLCTRDRGCSEHPVFPAPSDFWATNEDANLGRSAPREGETVSTVIASEAKQSMRRRKERMDCFASLAMTWKGRSALNTAHASITISLARTQSPLSSQIEHSSHATPRRTAVEIATCPRQCADALRSNFCRHTHRMVNPQAIAFTSAQTSLADGSWGAFAPASTNDASPCRCDRFAIEPAGGYTNAQL